MFQKLEITGKDNLVVYCCGVYVSVVIFTWLNLSASLDISERVNVFSVRVQVFSLFLLTRADHHLDVPDFLKSLGSSFPSERCNISCVNVVFSLFVLWSVKMWV